MSAFALLASMCTRHKYIPVDSLYLRIIPELCLSSSSVVFSYYFPMDESYPVPCIHPDCFLLDFLPSLPSLLVIFKYLRETYFPVSSHMSLSFKRYS